jgi:predicted amidohydrolase
MRVSLIHMQVSESPDKNLKTAEQMLYKAAEDGSKFICLPEYFPMPASVEDRASIDSVVKETESQH